jgi:hypothetical protein
LGRRIRVVTYRISKIINAPLRFVYDWCTDFREDDYKISGSKSRRTFLEKTKRQVILVTRYPSNGGFAVAVQIVSLHPPRRWHLDKFSQEENEVVEYRLRKLGSGRTKLDMVFKVEWKIPNVPSTAEVLEETNRAWDRYSAALEKDYKNEKKWS